MLLIDVMESRSIDWDEVDAAEHPQFGRGGARRAMLVEQQRFGREWARIREGTSVDEEQDGQVAAALQRQEQEDAELARQLQADWA